MDTLKPKKSKLITITVRGGFFTFWAILAHSEAPRVTEEFKARLLYPGFFNFVLAGSKAVS